MTTNVQQKNAVLPNTNNIPAAIPGDTISICLSLSTALSAYLATLYLPDAPLSYLSHKEIEQLLATRDSIDGALQRHNLNFNVKDKHMGDGASQATSLARPSERKQSAGVLGAIAIQRRKQSVGPLVPSSAKVLSGTRKLSSTFPAVLLYNQPASTVFPDPTVGHTILSKQLLATEATGSTLLPLTDNSGILQSQSPLDVKVGQHSILEGSAKEAAAALDTRKEHCLGPPITTVIQTDPVVFKHQSNSALKVLSSKYRKILSASAKSARAGDQNKVINRPKEFGHLHLSMIPSKLYTRLTHKQSNLVLMERILGSRFFRWWHENYDLLNYITLICLLFWSISIFILLLVPLSQEAQFILGGLRMCTIVYCAVSNSYHANFELFRRSVMTFEALFYILESLWYSIYLVPCFCFRSVGVFIAISQFLGLLTGPLICDACIPMMTRRGLRGGISTGFLMNTAVLVIIYLRITSSTLPICSYRFDFASASLFLVGGGGGTAGQVVSPAGYLNSPGVYLLDTCINRGVTTLILQFRVIYKGLKNEAHTCLLMRSEVQLVEQYDNELTPYQQESLLQEQQQQEQRFPAQQISLSGTSR